MILVPYSALYGVLTSRSLGTGALARLATRSLQIQRIRFDGAISFVSVSQMRMETHSVEEPNKTNESVSTIPCYHQQHRRQQQQQQQHSSNTYRRSMSSCARIENTACTLVLVLALVSMNGM